MRERPLPFRAPMVRAVLALIKRMTRRTVKWRHLAQGLNLSFSGLRAVETPSGWVLESDSRTSSEWRCDPTPCPYGKPGDRLWVREAWRTVAEADQIPPRDLDAGYRLWMEADAPHQPGFGKYRPPMFMPRWASRILLEITAVRVERLQNISEVDALAEGVTSVRSVDFDRRHFPAWRSAFDAAVQADQKPPVGPLPSEVFCALWSDLHGPDSWAANPWVWVVAFKRVEVVATPALPSPSASTS